MSEKVAFTVLVRTFNSEGTLGRVIDGLDLLEDDELLVVDSGSKDATLEIARSRGARVIEVTPPFHYSRSLNIGFAEAAGSWVVVLSSHCIPLRHDLLGRLRSVVSRVEDKVGVVYGRIMLYRPDRLDDCLYRSDADDKNERRKARGGNGFAVYRRDLVRSRGFTQDLITAEDLEWLLWAQASGYVSLTVNDAAVLYRNRGSLRHMYRKGLNETTIALRLEKMGRQGVVSSLWSFLVGVIHVIKLLLGGKVGPLDSVRLFIRYLGGLHARLVFR